MSIYENEETSREKLLALRSSSYCKECGGMLSVFFDFDKHKAYLACNTDQSHEGIAREARLFEPNIETGRERMEKEIGTEKTRALSKYVVPGTVMTTTVATQIVETLWGDAPAIEKLKAIMICQQYNLNPLMKHIYMVGYRRRDDEGRFIKDENGKNILDWTIMQGIQSTRLLAHRKHKFTYVDMSPRRASQSEIDKILDDTADSDRIYGFCHIKDLATGAEAFGLRGCLKKEKVKGVEKGNSPLNIAMIRSERQAIERLYPGEMPETVEIVDERYLDTGTGEVIKGEVSELKTTIGEITEVIKASPKLKAPPDAPQAKTKVSKAEVSPLALAWSDVRPKVNALIEKKVEGWSDVDLVRHKLNYLGAVVTAVRISEAFNSLSLEGKVEFAKMLNEAAKKEEKRMVGEAADKEEEDMPY